MFEWNESNVEELKTLMNKGLTTSQIAARIGAGSRNAVLGKIHRMKLRQRFVWDDTSEAKLQGLWESGMNYGKIAKVLGAPSGNSVYSNGIRMGMKPRKVKAEAEPGTSGKRVVPVTLAGPVPARARELSWPGETVAAVRRRLPGEGIAYLDVRPGMCRFPLWPDAGRTPLESKRFCGEQAAFGESYCESCHAVVRGVSLADWVRARRHAHAG